MDNYAQVIAHTHVSSVYVRTYITYLTYKQYMSYIDEYEQVRSTHKCFQSRHGHHPSNLPNLSY